MGSAYVERQPGDPHKKPAAGASPGEILTAYITEVQACDLDRQKVLFGQIDEFLKKNPTIVLD